MNVVVIDDAQVNLVLMAALLGKLPDCTATCFLSPAGALEHCMLEDPDLVIVDYMMPDMDGIEFIRRFRSHPARSQTPLLMVTADHEREVRYRALESGANDFLNKPLDRIEFTSRVKNMLFLRRSQVALANHARTLADEVRRATAEIYGRERETLNKLARAAEFRDPETGAHILRMAHDVGKLGTPDHILLKPGRLDPDEMVIMRRHASIGHEILKDSASPYMQLAATIALTHHEKFDGTGYPNGLAGEDIPLVGRIVAVADVFDALTSPRPYKPAWDLDKATAFLIEGRDSHFDAVCVDALLGQWDQVLGIRARFQDDT